MREGGQVTSGVATRRDLPALVALLADDPLGSQRESSGHGELDAQYQEAFSAIVEDPSHQIMVLRHDTQIIACLQLSLLPNLTYTGGWRGQIEGVRVHPDWRGRGLGERLIEEAVEIAQSKDCVLVQLTTDTRRPDAIRFYERLGFVPSHCGMKRHLRQPNER